MRPAQQELSRREFLKLAGLATAATMFPFPRLLVEAGVQNPETEQACPLTEFSPHYLVQQGGIDGAWVPLPVNAQVEAATQILGKAYIRLKDDNDVVYFLNPLAIEPKYVAQSPLERIERLVREYSLPLENIPNLSNKELLHEVRFKLMANEEHESQGYLFEITSDKQALVWLPQRLSERYFETEGVTIYPQLICVPDSLIVGFDPDTELTNNIEPTKKSATRNTPEKSLPDLALEQLWQQDYPKTHEAAQSFDWQNKVGYQHNPEMLRGESIAETAENLLKYCTSSGGGGTFFIQTLRSLYPQFEPSIQTISLRNSFTVNGVAYITGINQSNQDGIYKIANNTVERIISFTAENAQGRRVGGAFPLPEKADRFWVVSFYQSSGIQDSLELIDLHNQPNGNRKLRFPSIGNNPYYDLYCIYVKFNPTGTHAMVTRYGFGFQPPPPTGRVDEGGGEWIVDLAELTRRALIPGTGDIEVPTVRITGTNHSFGLGFTDGYFDKYVQTATTPSTVQNRVYLPLILNRFLANLSIRGSEALCWHKNNDVDTYRLPSAQPTGLVPRTNLGLTTGWNPHERISGTIGSEARSLAYTYPRPNMGGPHTAIFGVLPMRKNSAGSFEFVEIP
ncbi:MAG TPA: twin-arginine translocation signal domain-containing protein [Candidatus Woesebacteria bacterium]|nr:twin-arginine translocation signal domain-containing protein [Candidatus Woesebacteria bacterium]